MDGLSCFIEALLDKLDTVLVSPGFIKEDKKSALQLIKLKAALTMVSSLITDAGEKQLHQLAVKNWLEDLEEALCDAEDVVDEILYDNARIKLQEAESLKLKDLARRLLPASIKRNLKQGSSLEKTLQVIDAIANRKEELHLRELEAQNELALSRSYSSLPVSTSLLDENQIYGRDKRKLVRELLQHGDKNLDAIALVDIGGLGKTTLAKLVYNDKSVDAHFELKAWISVGSEFDVHRITREILVAFTSSSSFGDLEFDVLQRKLRDMLVGKRFLLILDDVWNEDTSKWKDLQSLLESGCLGSKILVTTRMEIVSHVMGCSTPYLLPPLTMEDCWSIFATSAFQGRNRSEVETLEDIGRKIVEKCGGLPLLVRAIGGLLHFKKTLHEWHHVLDELKIISGDHTIERILQLSYYHLPAHLKRCFAYCLLFPKGYVFDMEELFRLWMAEGFLQQSARHSMERVGAECFNSLVKRSFFIPVDNSRLIMDDLMHDLAMSVSRPYWFRLEPKTSVIPSKTRHLSLERSQYDNADKLTATKRLRTLYLINSPSGHGSCQKSPKAILTVIFSGQQRLRVLLLPHYLDAELPASISKLKYLRCLDVSDSTLKELPESLCTLYCLQILILTNCSSLLMLPQGIVKLVNLRKLQIKGTGLKQMPEKIGRLTSLQSLSNFIVGHGGSGSSIKELGTLPHLHGSLSVSELQNVYSASEASETNLKAMQYLDELELEWNCNNEDSAKHQEEVLENLKPSGDLKKLSIRFYGGRVLPNWLGDSSFLKVTSLHLADCRNCESLAPLGQLSLLENLIIERLNGIKSIGHEFYGGDVSGCKPFLSLKTLKFMEMSHWEEWILLEEEGEGYFTRLEEFYIINCPVFIGGLPKSLPALRKLEIAGCEKLKASLPWTPEGCILTATEDKKTVSKGDGEPASQLSSTMAQTSGNELQLEWDGTNKNPADEGAVQDDLELSGKLEKPSTGSCGGKEPEISPAALLLLRSDDGQTFAPGVPPSVMHEEQDDNQEKPLSGEDANQQLPSSSRNFSSTGIAQNQAVVPEVSPTMMHQKQDDNHEEPLAGEDGNQQSSSAQSMEEPTDNSLRIENFSLDELPEEILKRSSLQHLYVIDCIHLKTFPLSPSLKKLYIHNCRSLNFPQPNNVKNQELRLEDLSLGSSCDSLETFLLSYFPKLKALSLCDCRNLESLSIDKKSQAKHTSLKSLEIKNCPNFRSFLDDKCKAPKLTSLVFFDCGSLKSLQWIQSLKALQSLYINKCPELESLSVEGLPSGLVILCISFCDKITPQRGWKLDELQSLRHFEIEGGCLSLESFPEEGLLPTNLNSLRISFLSNLTSLNGKGFQNLTSLRKLEIHCCNKLDSLPEHGMPSSLSSLSITDCSLLNPKLQSRKGKEWSRVAHIPSIHLDEVSG